MISTNIEKPKPIIKKKIIIKNIIPEYRLHAIKHFTDLKYLTEEQIKQLELSIYNYAVNNSTILNIKSSSPEFIKIYKYKFMHIILNINKDSYVKNDYLYNKINTNEIKINELVNLKPHESYPKQWEFHNDIIKTKINAINLGDISFLRTTLFICSRCKKNDTIYKEQQTRSADEPATVFITCRNCGKKWTQN